MPEEWGGNVVCIPISALTGKGVDQLLEMVVLQAQLLELKAAYEGDAHCYVLESRLNEVEERLLRLFVNMARFV